MGVSDQLIGIGSPNFMFLQCRGWAAKRRWREKRIWDGEEKCAAKSETDAFTLHSHAPVCHPSFPASLPVMPSSLANEADFWEWEVEERLGSEFWDGEELRFWERETASTTPPLSSLLYFLRIEVGKIKYFFQKEP